MANAEQLDLLKQSAEIWKMWRTDNIGVEIDLSGADLREADLSNSDLSHADLRGAHLTRANFREANMKDVLLKGSDLRKANLTRANLLRADINHAFLKEANISMSELTGANLSGTQLVRADFTGANLTEANLHEADLTEAILSGTNLSRADLSNTNLSKTILYNAIMDRTILSFNDLGSSIDLGQILHQGPSSIGLETLHLSRGRIPEIFLQGCGLSDADIEYAKLSNPDLSNEEINKILYRMYDLRATQALQISPLFISYSHGDGPFVDKLEKHLNNKGIRFWRDIHDMKAGRIEAQIDRAINQNRIVLLVLSEHSLRSDWVEHEVRTARELEKEMGRDVLCPVALDESWKDSKWEKHVMEQVMKYNILDFSAWRDNSKFGDMFRKLIDGLELFYKGNKL